MKARLLERRPLSTDREVLHVVLGRPFDTVPGDSINVLPKQRADDLLAFLGTDDPTIREALTWKVAIDRTSHKLARALGLAGIDETEDVLSVLRRTGVKMHPQQLVSLLAPHLPRAYSVASADRAHPGELHLCVAVLPRGVASTWLRDLDTARDLVEVEHKPTRSFRIADHPDADVILVGPGTGIAPFRALLEERRALSRDGGAKGRAWLFTGGRTEGDVLYREELDLLQLDGTLSRLDVALSRVSERKTYVQDLMRGAGADVWSWIDRGAHVYVSGDGKRMAKGVQEALLEIVAQHGRMDETAARQFLLERLAKVERRYLRDVY